MPSLFLLNFFSSNTKIILGNNFIKKVYKSIFYLMPTFILTLFPFCFEGKYEMAFKINESWFNLSSKIPNESFFLPQFPSGSIESLS